MAEPKPFASLSPSLLARKGGARPAMRPQQSMQHYRDATARQLEDDLGWNDMGHESHEAVAQPEPAPAPAEVVALKPAVAVPAPAVPEVVRQQDAIAERVAEPEAKPVAVKPVAVKAVTAKPAAKLTGARRSALQDGRRAAFTLRLDSERHLQLRLACTIGNRSAQQIVTEALDQFLASQPELASLAAQVGKRR